MGRAVRFVVAVQISVQDFPRYHPPLLKRRLMKARLVKRLAAVAAVVWWGLGHGHQELQVPISQKKILFTTLTERLGRKKLTLTPHACGSVGRVVTFTAGKSK